MTCMPYAQGLTFRVYAPLTTQGLFFRAEVPTSMTVWLSVILLACKTCEVKGHRDVTSTVTSLIWIESNLALLCLRARFTVALSAYDSSSIDNVVILDLGYTV